MSALLPFLLVERMGKARSLLIPPFRRIEECVETRAAEEKIIELFFFKLPSSSSSRIERPVLRFLFPLNRTRVGVPFSFL